MRSHWLLIPLLITGCDELRDPGTIEETKPKPQPIFQLDGESIIIVHAIGEIPFTQGLDALANGKLDDVGQVFTPSPDSDTMQRERWLFSNPTGQELISTTGNGFIMEWVGQTDGSCEAIRDQVGPGSNTLPSWPYAEHNLVYSLPPAPLEPMLESDDDQQFILFQPSTTDPGSLDQVGGMFRQRRISNSVQYEDHWILEPTFVTLGQPDDVLLVVRRNGGLTLEQWYAEEASPTDTLATATYSFTSFEPGCQD